MNPWDPRSMSPWPPSTFSVGKPLTLQEAGRLSWWCQQWWLQWQVTWASWSGWERKERNFPFNSLELEFGSKEFARDFHWIQRRISNHPLWIILRGPSDGSKERDELDFPFHGFRSENDLSRFEIDLRKGFDMEFRGGVTTGFVRDLVMALRWSHKINDSHSRREQLLQVVHSKLKTKLKTRKQLGNTSTLYK